MDHVGRSVGSSGVTTTVPRNITFVLLPILIAIAALLFWHQQEQIYGNQGRLSVIQQGDAVVLSWHSEIGRPMERRLREAFKEWTSKTDKFVIDLNSPGGALREGRKVIDLINSMKASHSIETHVGPGSYCLSMCVPIYLRGQSRVAAGSSRWMFHEPTAHNFFTDEEIQIPQSEREAYNNRFFDRYYGNSEMDSVWRENLRKEWIGKDVWRTGQQLVQEDSNIISELY